MATNRKAGSLTLNARVLKERKLRLQIHHETLVVLAVAQNELLPELDLLLPRIFHRLQPAASTDRTKPINAHTKP
jgi:hypothetical protein